MSRASLPNGSVRIHNGVKKQKVNGEWVPFDQDERGGRSKGNSGGNTKSNTFKNTKDQGKEVEVNQEDKVVGNYVVSKEKGDTWTVREKEEKQDQKERKQREEDQEAPETKAINELKEKYNIPQSDLDSIVDKLTRNSNKEESVKEEKDRKDRRKELEDTKKSIETQIEEESEIMEKSTQTAKEALIKSIQSMDPKELKEKAMNLSKSNKELLVEVLEEMKKGRAAESMDKNYSAKYHEGNINDTKIQEDKVDDDADEKLVDKKKAYHKHQGDETPKGKDNHVIKSEVEKTLDLVKSDDKMLKTMIYKMCDSGKCKKDIMDKCMAKGMDSGKVSMMIDERMKYHNKKMHKSDEEVEKGMYKNCDKGKEMYEKDMKDKKMSKEEYEAYMKKKNNKDMEKSVITPKAKKEEDQLSDTDEMTEGTPRADKKPSGEEKVVYANKKNKMAKSVQWTDENALLKANTLGRNFNYSVNEYYDQILKSVKEDLNQENVAKSEEGKADSIQDLIEKGLDETASRAMYKSMGEQKPNIGLSKSFSDEDMLDILKISKEDADKI